MVLTTFEHRILIHVIACNQQTNSSDTCSTKSWHLSLLSFRSHNLLFGFVLVFIHLDNKNWEWRLNSHRAMSHASTNKFKNMCCFYKNWWTTSSWFHIHTCLRMQLVSLGFSCSLPHLHRWEGSRTEGRRPGYHRIQQNILRFTFYFTNRKRQFFLVPHN